MAETNNITSLNLTFKTDVKEQDIELVDALTDALSKFGKVDVKDDTAGKLNKISDALKKFNEIEFEAGIGKNVKDLVSTLSMVENIRDITPYANRLKDGFDILADASTSFTGNNARLSGSLGKGIGNLAIALKHITNVQDIVPYAENIRNGFAILADASKPFENVSPTIRSGLGESVTGLVDAINKMDSVRDISGVGENLINGLDTIAAAVTPFNNLNPKIGVTLGRGITGLVDAINQIRNVKDISSQAQNIENSFKIIATATRNFNGIEGANFSGIARLITTMNSVGKIKKIDDTVIDNANKLVEAINILDKNTNQSSMRLSALARVVDSVGRSMNTAEKSTKKFDWSLKLRNLTYVIFNLERLGRVSMGVVRKLYGLVDSFGDVQNTLSFFTNSLGSEAKKTAELIQVYSDFGAVNFSDFANQVAKLNQVYKGYGISSENAAKMALNMTQMAHDASFALGKNGKDIELWNQRVMSVATGQTRAGYYFGVDTSVKALSETFDEMDTNASKATRSIAAYTAMLENTKALQGQLAREYSNTYVQMDVFRNKMTQLKEAMGRALVPLYQSIIKWGLIALKVTERVIDALVRMFGGSGFELINYGQMIDEIGTSTDNVGAATDNIAGGIKNATKAAKEFQKTITGIDQVFTINDRKEKDPKAGSALGGGIFDAPIGGYDWLDALASADNLLMLKDIEDTANNIVGTLKKWIPIIGAISAGLATWKLLNFVGDLGTSITRLNEVSSILGGLAKVTIGVSLVLIGYQAFVAGLKGLFEGDFSWLNIGLTIGGAIITGVGLAMTASGVLEIITKAFPKSSIAKFATEVGINTGSLIKVGIGAGLALGGIVSIVAGIKDIFENGVDWKNVGMVIGGAIATGIGISMAAVTIKNVLQGTKTSKSVVDVATSTLNDATSIGKATNSFKMPSWTSIAKVFTLVAGGIALVVGSIYLIGKIDTSTFNKARINLIHIGNGFMSIAAPLGITLAASAAIGFLLNKHIIKWTDIAAGLVAVDVGIINMMAIVALSSKWNTDGIEKGKKNMALVANAFNAIEMPLNLILIKAGAIGAIIIGSMGLGALAIASGILVINTTVMDMLALTDASSKWDTATLTKGSENIALVGKAFDAINPSLSHLIDMIEQIGSNMTIFAKLTGRSYDFDKAFGQLQDVMTSLFYWIGGYQNWDTPQLEKGSEAIDMAGKAGVTLNTTLQPLITMIESIGKHTDRLFGIGSIDYDKSLGILKRVMDTMLKWIGSYQDWETSELQKGSVAIDLAGKAGSTLNEVMIPLVDMLNKIGKQTNNIFGLGDYNYDASLSLLKGIMDDMIKWVGEISKLPNIEDVKKGAEVIGVISPHLKSINDVFGELLPILDSIGKKTNNIFGIGDYNYSKAMKIVSDSLKSIVGSIENLGRDTEVKNVDKGIIVINKSKDVIKELDGFTSIKTNALADAAKEFVTYSQEMRKAFNELALVKTDGVQNIISALKSLDLSQFRNIGRDMVKALTDGINNYQFNLNPTTNKIKSAFTFSTVSYGTNIASGVVNGINNYNYNITSSVNKIKNAFTFSTVSIGTEIARGVVNGINGYSVNVNTFTNRVKNGLTFSGNSIGSNIAKGVVSGINSSNTNISKFTNKLKKAMTDAFNIKSPSRWARDVVGNMIGMGTVIGINDSDVNIDPFKRGLELQFAGISSELEIDPKINMPTLDTSTLTNGVATMFSHLNTDVSGEFDLTNDGTERAVKDLIVKTEQTNQLLQKAIDKELVVAIDKREIGKVVTEEQRLNAVRSNNTFK